MANGQLKLHPALFVIDMQNTYCHDEGTFAKAGLPVSNMKAVIPVVKKMIDSFQDKGLPVFFFRMGFKEDYSDSGILLDKCPFVRDLRGCIIGTWDAEIVEELRPSPEDLQRNKNWVVIDKNRNSAFYKTGLDDKLVEMGINQLIVTGVGTNVCVEATFLDAITHGFPAVVVSDATASVTDEMRDASIENMRSCFGDAATVKQIEKALAGFASR